MTEKNTQPQPKAADKPKIHKTWCALGWVRGGGYCNCGHVKKAGS